MASNFCINCGAPLPENAKFCSACGTMIQQAPTQQPAQQPPAQQQPVQQPPVQQQYEQQPAYPPAGGYDPNMPPPLTTEPPTQQPQGGYYAPAGAPPPQFPPKKKSNGALIALIAILALAVLGAGAWAIYNYVIKSKLEKTTEEIIEDENDHNSFSTDPDDETPSEIAIDSTEVAENIDSVENITEPQEPVPSIPEKTTPKVKERKGDPWGMTDEEAAQNQRNRRGNVPSIPRTRQQPPRNGAPWGMTDEEAAQNQRNRRGDVPSIPRAKQQQPRNSEPWGMTDEEAAQIRRNGGDIPQGLQNGDPWGMTDEEAAQMRKMQQRSNKKQKRRSRGTGGGVG